MDHFWRNGVDDHWLAVLVVDCGLKVRLSRVIEVVQQRCNWWFLDFVGVFAYFSGAGRGPCSSLLADGLPFF